MCYIRASGPIPWVLRLTILVIPNLFDGGQTTGEAWALHGTRVKAYRGVIAILRWWKATKKTVPQVYIRVNTCDICIYIYTCVYIYIRICVICIFAYIYIYVCVHIIIHPHSINMSMQSWIPVRVNDVVWGGCNLQRLEWQWKYDASLHWFDSDQEELCQTICLGEGQRICPLWKIQVHFTCG